MSHTQPGRRHRSCQPAPGQPCKDLQAFHYTAGGLSGAPSDGVGGHWWYQLQPTDLFAAQLCDPVGKINKPAPW